ncbi:hypothetical protein V8Q34_14610 [Blautia sp. JLR.GB0024]|uniref:hypothetical protein n=1 Tax=Blautia sp. JLR.GB0024 TaxID=3123295 RepID=UPI0030044E59
MKILRSFQVINSDKEKTISSIYNEADETGSVTKRNAQDSFYAIDPELKAAISVIEKYINENRLNRLAGE